MSELRLVIFDVDGTLVDSQVMIFEAFTHAYKQVGLPVPERATALSYVGMSLETIFPQLSPEADAATHAALTQGYRDAYFHIRQTQGSNANSPFFPGAREVLDQLRAQDWTLMAVATGKSTRGLDKLTEGHGLEGYFASRQTADDHPSKPSPSMINTILSETGVSPDRAVMVGDTTFDMDMARAAGIKTIGVSWGYHPVEHLQADRLIHAFAALPQAIDDLIGPQG
ncbi:HAD-IA family hydrolase [Cognatiyoonia sp. IB215446]|uniref:HAD-IA family hydrolase n=1 Tax=Cognatiyoonia sp. IB215446 TaxID=3097355 RepID=UPI002A17E067|nr:HAD-IA family hydrolase [Cognatiyoonia sp. IB215446]MDX8350127.1 HAD-IA family hydrolase [Cognatiyoonia sp. IB215446]